LLLGIKRSSKNPKLFAELSLLRLREKKRSAYTDKQKSAVHTKAAKVISYRIIKHSVLPKKMINPELRNRARGQGKNLYGSALARD
jgi:hypothetical protein